MTLDDAKQFARERRAAGDSVASLAKLTCYPRHLVRAWTHDIEPPMQPNERQQHAIELFEGGASKKAIARVTGAALTTVKGWLDSEWYARRQARDRRSQQRRAT